jgi:Icc protein
MDKDSSLATPPISVLQITDSHLGDQPGETLLGLDTDQSLQQVIQLANQQRGISDLLLATGDLTNSGTAQAYQRFQQMTSPLAKQSLWLPGNHDNPAVMQATMAASGELARSIEIGNWQIIMLDSTIPGMPGGELSATELDFLNNSLKQSTAEHVLLCLHHHPIPIACEWLDSQQVTNSDAFFSVVDSYDAVRGVLWGHIHQQLDQQRNGVKLMATPSTCVQFAAHSDEFKVSQLNPGYRWLELNANGSIDTGVSRLTSNNFVIDYDASGY